MRIFLFRLFEYYATFKCYFFILFLLLFISLLLRSRRLKFKSYKTIEKSSRRNVIILIGLRLFVLRFGIFQSYLLNSIVFFYIYLRDYVYNII